MMCYYLNVQFQCQRVNLQVTYVIFSVNCSESIGIVTRLQAGLKRIVVRFPAEASLFFSFKMSRPAVGPTQPTFAVRTFGCYVRDGGGKEAAWT